VTRLVFLSAVLSMSSTLAASAQNAQAQTLAATAPIRLPSAIPSQESNEIAIKTQDWCDVYPPLAVRLDQEGKVVLTFAVTAQGTVTDVKVTSSSGHDALDEVSTRCAATWHFQPAMRNGMPVAATRTAEFVYSLKPPTIRSRDQDGAVAEFHPQFPWSR
jgi:protein TonB